MMTRMTLAAMLMGLGLPALADGAGPARVAVISAFAPEWEVLKGQLQNSQSQELHGTTFLSGQLAGQEVVLFLSGVSMVNAAMTTQMALEHFNISSIVFSGIAGGVDPALNIGDVVVADQWGQYLEAVFARETSEGFAPPPFIATELPNYGMIFPRGVGVAKAGGLVESQFWFPVDPDLLTVAQKVAGDLTLEACAKPDSCLSHKPKIVVGGNGVSGQAFVDNATFRTYAFDTFDAKVLDMESAAVAHVAAVNETPFIAFRSLSDLAGGGEGGNEMGTFMALASANSAAVVTAYLAALPQK